MAERRQRRVAIEPAAEAGQQTQTLASLTSPLPGATRQPRASRDDTQDSSFASKEKAGPPAQGRKSTRRLRFSGDENKSGGGGLDDKSGSRKPNVPMERPVQLQKHSSLLSSSML